MQQCQTGGRPYLEANHRLLYQTNWMRTAAVLYLQREFHGRIYICFCAFCARTATEMEGLMHCSSAVLEGQAYGTLLSLLCRIESWLTSGMQSVLILRCWKVQHCRNKARKQASSPGEKCSLPLYTLHQLPNCVTQVYDKTACGTPALCGNLLWTARSLAGGSN